MAKALSAGTFAPVRRVINEDYKPADESYPMGGTVVPSVVTDDPQSSGVRFPVHAETLTGCNLVKIDKLGNVQTTAVSARAMEILREGNRDGKKMGYEEAIKLAGALEEAEKKAADEKHAKETAAAQQELDALPPVEPVLLPPDIGRPSNIPVMAGAVTVQTAPEPEFMKAQRSEKVPAKKGRRGRMAMPAAPAYVPKVAVSFSSSLGVMSIMAEKVFIGGPGQICLVIIQYSPEGHFFIPPQVDEPVMISCDGKVYKCLTGIYYQIPGTPVMHTVYFIAKE